MTPSATSDPSDQLPELPRILTNMAFWQSPLWIKHTDSIYPLRSDRDPDFVSPLREALRLFSRRRNYNLILTMGARTSLFYGLLCLAAHVPSHQVICEFFLDPPHCNPIWRIKNALYRITARRARGILANSSQEADAIRRRYGLPAERVIYVPMHTNIRDPHMEQRDEGFIFSAGRTWRDYPVLLEALRRMSTPAVIICGRADLRGVPIPPHVTVLRETPRSVYLDYLSRCRAVAVPLLPVERATGQVVVLEAMALGKPVVATDVSGTRDLVVDGVTGLLVPPHDAAAMSAALHRLITDPDLARRLGCAALERVKKEFTIERHTRHKLTALAYLGTAPDR